MTILFSNPSIMEAKDRRVKELEAEVEFLQESENGMLQTIATLEDEIAAIKTQLEQMDDERLSWKTEAEQRGEALAAARAEVENLKTFQGCETFEDFFERAKDHPEYWNEGLVIEIGELKAANKAKDALLREVVRLFKKAKYIMETNHGSRDIWIRDMEKLKAKLEESTQ